MPENRGPLAGYLQRALDERGWTKAQLARESGVPESNVGRYVAVGGLPTIDNARRLADALNVPLKKFLLDVGLFTAEELDAEIPQPPAKPPADMTDAELAEALEEASRRFKKRPPTAAERDAKPDRFLSPGERKNSRVRTAEPTSGGAP